MCPLSWRVHLARERDMSSRSEIMRIRYNIEGIRDADCKFHSICPDCPNSYLIPHFIMLPGSHLAKLKFTSFSKVFYSIFTYFSVQSTGKQILYIFKYIQANFGNNTMYIPIDMKFSNLWLEKALSQGN